ncbi:hypothetical protein Aduo_007665 [Ancylostoma duodenale]
MHTILPKWRSSILFDVGGKQKGREKYKQEDTCSRAATYNKTTKRCQCNNPEADGVKMDPEKYKGFPEGVVCYDCDTTVEGRSVVFVLDESGTVDANGWIQQIEFMKDVANNIKTVRTGIVIMQEPPKISMKMGLHSKKELEDWVEKNKEYEAMWTLTGHALYLARTMLEGTSMITGMHPPAAIAMFSLEDI